MRFTRVHSVRQRKSSHRAKLPPFLRPDGLKVELTGEEIFPQNSVDLFNIDDDWQSCTCYIRGLLFLWRFFFVLVQWQRSPHVPLPDLFRRSHPMDLIKIRGNTWVYSLYNFSCASCYPVLKKFFRIMEEAFFPDRHLFDFTQHEARIAVFWDTVPVSAPALLRKFELGLAVPSTLLSLILSGVRNVAYRLQYSLGDDLGVNTLKATFEKLRDVIGGDLFDEDFTLAYISTGHLPRELVVYRYPIHMDPAQPNGIVKVFRLYWDKDCGPYDAVWDVPHRQQQRRRWHTPAQPRVQPSRPLPNWVSAESHDEDDWPAQGVNPFGYPFHQPCFSRFLPSTISPPVEIAECCRSLQPPSHGPATPLSERLALSLSRRIRGPLSAPASPFQHRLGFRRAHLPASKSPRPTTSVPTAARQAPRPAAAGVRQQLARQLPTSRAVKTSVAARPAPAAVRAQRLRRRLDAGVEDFSGERTLDPVSYTHLTLPTIYSV